VHELLHWAIDRCGGSSHHDADSAADRAADPIYRFEKAAYPDWATRERTMEKMDAAAYKRRQPPKREMEIKRWVRN